MHVPSDELDPATSAEAATSTEAATDDSTGGGLMRWSIDEARVIGAMIEKALATPQNYPLSLNALTLACNQTTNRDPVMMLDDRVVEEVLTEGKARGLVRFVHPRSGRGVTKYRHVVDEVLDLEAPDLAVISVLALRGPQTVGELRTRTDRLHGFADNAEIESVLGHLCDREGRPLAARLERESGRREARWIQLLCPEQGEDRAGEPSPTSAVRAATSASSDPDPGLRAEVDQLRHELATLRAEFDAFRAEFG